MICYASRTGTRRNIAALAEAGWGWMVAPSDMGGPVRAGMRHALDNGAWRAFSAGKEWDGPAFLRAVARYGPGADFVVVPDVVGNAPETLAKISIWLPRLAARADLAGARLLVAIQDGMTFGDVEQLVGGRVGLFLGGTTDWKEQAIIPWGRWAKERGLYVHCGRVNTARRMALCQAGGVDSIDGTSATRFAKNVPKLTRAASQPDLLAPPRRKASQ